MESIELTTSDGLRLNGALHDSSSATNQGAVLQAHGITVDMDEGGMFVRLAETLADSGFNVLRFSYRGHGDSDGTEQSATIAGEMLDVEAAYHRLRSEFDGPYYFVVASFGAVSTCNILEYIDGYIDGLVLWNPVLDLEKTFVAPELDWGVNNFTGTKIDELHERGFLTIDGEFRLSRTLYTELQVHDPLSRFLKSSTPAMVIHGDSDSAVPYEVTKEASRQRDDCEFCTIENADHGFESIEPGASTTEKENEAIGTTRDWLMGE